MACAEFEAIIKLTDGINYHFSLRVVTTAATTEGNSTGMKYMDCSMYTVTNSGNHGGSEYARVQFELTIAGYGEISEAHSECVVVGEYGNVVMSVY